MRDENCIFCKIIAGEIPARTIYEDEDFKVILDANPASRGHALILPKEHAANLYEIRDDLLAKAAMLAKKLAVHMTGVLACDGFNILQNNGEIAGQTVFHFHIHLVPRYKGMKNDDMLNWTHEKFTAEEQDSICQQLQAGVPVIRNWQLLSKAAPAAVCPAVCLFVTVHTGLCRVCPRGIHSKVRKKVIPE